MVLSCSVYNCNQRFTKGSGISFHRFPQTEDLLQQWLIAIRRTDWKPHAQSRICSLHFTQDNYESNGWSSLTKLKDNAVPSTFYLPEHLLKRKSGMPSRRKRNVVISNSSSGDASRSLEENIANTNEARSEEPKSKKEENVGDLKTLEENMLDEAKKPTPQERSVVITNSSSCDASRSLEENITNINEAISEEPKSKKKKRYLGDFKTLEENMAKEVRELIETTKKVIAAKTKRIKLLQQSNRRMLNKIDTLENLIALNSIFLPHKSQKS